MREEIDSFEDLPEELRPPSIRHQLMRGVGIALVFVGCLLLASAAIWLPLAGTDVGFALPGRTEHVSLAIAGSVSLIHGVIAVIAVEFA